RPTPIRALARGAPAPPGGSPHHARAGGAHSGRDPCRGLDPARASEEARARIAAQGRMSPFLQQLERAWEKNDSLVCVGLDPEIERFPAHVRAAPSPIFQFNRSVIDATADLVCAYKPQFAHYAAYEAEDQLERTIEYIHRVHPGVPVILDAKRGDIGNTAERYAIEAFERYGADAVTVNPYLGGDSLEPFLRHSERGVIVLCRTSNPGAIDLQDLE